jgi:hypothetical protein
MTKHLPDGIYLDMPFDQYLELERMSAGGLTDMMEGPSAFWARSWLNPDREEEEPSKAMLHGSAYHCARLEPEEFPRRFVRDVTADDYKGRTILMNGTDIGEALADMGHPKKKAGETVLEQAERLRTVYATEIDKPMSELPVIWPLERAAFDAARGRDGRAAIDPKTFDEIQRDAARLRANPEVASLIEGGLAEVTILFTLDGVPCKIRPDYIGAGFVTHLKTWETRSAGKTGNQAVADAFRFNGYYRTGWFYELGMRSIREQDLTVRHTRDGSPMKITDIEAPEAGVLATHMSEHGGGRETFFLFLRRGGVPDIRARRIRWFSLPPGIREQEIGASTDGFQKVASAMCRKADLEVRSCLQLYRESLEQYLPGEPWFPRDMMGDIEDADFSDYWLDSVEDPR